jgi:uncharacterized protein
MKQIFKYFFLLFFAININAQNIGNAEKDSLKIKSVELFREIYWNNIPKPISWTNDYEDLFSDLEQTKLDSIISKFERETSIEISIVTIDTIKTSKEKFDDLTLHIAQTWKIGKVEKDNGILIGISKGYRRIRIQNGDGIEKIVTNEETKEIIENYFIPEFKKGEYYSGTLNGLCKIIRILKDKSEK